MIVAKKIVMTWTFLFRKKWVEAKPFTAYCVAMTGGAMGNVALLAFQVVVRTQTTRSPSLRNICGKDHKNT